MPLSNQIAHNRIRAIFFLHGAAFSSWVPHIPLVQERLGFGHDDLGAILLAAAIGVLTVMPVAGRLSDKFGSERVARYSGIAYFISVGIPVYMPSFMSMAIAMFAMGFFGAFLDISMNANGLNVERTKKRSVMSGLHGCWSLGGFAGAGTTAAWFALPLPISWHLPVMLSIFLVLHLILQRQLMPDCAVQHDEPEKDGLSSRQQLMFLTLLPFGACAFIGQFGEGVITDWVTVLMTTELQSGPTLAAVGFACYSATMAITRLSGDWLVTKFGRAQILLASSACASFGLFVLALSPHYLIAWVGCAVAGVGLATILPLLISAAAQATGKGGGAVVSTIAATGYTALMAGPPIVGAIGEKFGLVSAFVLTASFLALIIPVYMLTMRGRLRVTGNS